MAVGNNGLIRTDTGRNDIEFVDTLAYNSSYSILKRTGTGRSDIAWESINTGSDTSGVTAGTSDVLDGKYFVNASGSKLEGTMQNQGAKTASLNCGGSYTIPKGYHNGSGKVTANSLSSQTSANATAADIVSGKTAWVNGSKITGTLKHYVAYTKNLCSNKKVSMSISPSPSNVSTHTKVTIGTIDMSSISYFSNAYAILVKANESGTGTKCSIILPGPKLMSDVITDSFDRLMAGAGEFGALTTGTSLALIHKLDVYICAKLNSNSNPTGITLSAFAYLAGYNSKISGSFNLDANVVGFII